MQNFIIANSIKPHKNNQTVNEIMKVILMAQKYYELLKKVKNEEQIE